MNELHNLIVNEIRASGPIPFSRYMDLCLYHSELGYYSRHAEQFGKSGDFYTSSDVHAVFGRLLARQFEEIWRALGSPETVTVRELGPGRGLFAQDVLDWSEKKFPDFFRALRYLLVEQSPALRQKIAQTLGRHFASGKARFDDEMATENAVRANEELEIVFANEFFDAIPVDVVSRSGSLRIGEKDGWFTESWAPASAEELEFLDRYSIHPEDGERVELCLKAQQYLPAPENFGRRFFIAVDYGYTRDEQLAGRHRGTLKAIRQHSVSANPYEAPGEQDITADVNFTALAAILKRRGFEVLGLVTQSQFLMGIGEADEFADAFEDCRLPQERTKVALQLKHLVTPAGMGESFQVLMASRGIEREKVQALAGLNFGRASRT